LDAFSLAVPFAIHPQLQTRLFESSAAAFHKFFPRKIYPYTFYLCARRSPRLSFFSFELSISSFLISSLVFLGAAQLRFINFSPEKFIKRIIQLTTL
jgi:hypothetical protein